MTVAEHFRTLAQSALDAWDGVQTRELVDLIYAATGEKNPLEELERLKTENAELSRGGVHWWHQMRAVAIALGCKSLSDVKGELERLKGIVNQLPKTADGVPIVPGMDLYTPSKSSASGVMVARNVSCQPDSQDIYDLYYSTHEAAEAAKEQPNG